MTHKQSAYIGIDVGGSKILLQTFTKELKILEEIKVKTDTRHGHRGFLKQLYGLINRVFHKKIKGIGIAAPGIVDVKKRVLVHAPHLPAERNLKLGKLIQERFGADVHIENDINALLFAEHQKRTLQKHNNIVAVMVGTGLGGAMMVDGKLVYGKNGFAGEVGHMVIDQNSPLKTFEQNTSGHFIPKIARHLGIKSKQAITAGRFGEMLKIKHKDALLIQKTLAENMGVGLANLNLIFNPDVILLGGSIYHIYLSGKKDGIKAAIARQALNKQSPPLIDASEKTSVAKGAVLLLLEKKA